MLAMRVPDRRLAGAGRAVGLLWIGALFVLAGLVGLVPLPASWLTWLAPGTAAIESPAALRPPVVRVDRTVLGVAELGLLWGTLVVTAVWASATRLSKRVEEPIIMMTLLVSACAVAHAMTGQQAFFGFWPSGATHLYLAPFVNPNHAGALMLLALPTLLGRVLARI